MLIIKWHKWDCSDQLHLFQASLDHPGPRGDPDWPGRDRGAGQRGPHQGRPQLRLHPHQTRRMVSYEAHDQTDKNMVILWIILIWVKCNYCYTRAHL